MWGGIPPRARDLALRPSTSYALVGATVALLVVDLTSVHRTGDEVALVYRTIPAVLLAATVGLAVLRARAGLDSALDRRFVLVCCALAIGLASIGPVRGSQDLWAYAMYGRVSSVHHADPYVHPPKDFPDDPYLHLMHRRWRGTDSVYGPLFDGYAATVTRVTGSSTDATRLAFKLTAGACAMATLLLLARRRVEPAAIAFAGLHPATVLYGVAGGHNDAMVALALLCAVLLARRRSPVLAGLAAAAACLIKVATGLVVIGLVAWLWSLPRREGRRDAALLAGTFGAVTGLAYLRAGLPSALEPLRKASEMTSWTSFWRPVSLHFHGSILGEPVSTLAMGLVLVLVALVLLRHRVDAGPEVLVAAVLLAYLAGSEYTLVWYLMWVLPIAALRWRSGTMWLVVLLATAYVLPDPSADPLRLTAVLVVAALAYASWRGRAPSGQAPSVSVPTGPAA